MSINKAVIVGNLVRDPEMRTTPNGVSVTNFTVAANRRCKSQDGQQQANFIDCVAWRRKAEFIAKYFTKGSKIGIVGTIQTRAYDDQNGNKRYVTEVVVDEAEFVTSKAQNTGEKQQEAVPDGLEEYEPLDDSEIPF